MAAHAGTVTLDVEANLPDSILRHRALTLAATNVRKWESDSDVTRRAAKYLEFLRGDETAG